MPKQDAPTFQVDDAKIIYRNFEGRPGDFNDPGDRNFCVLIDPDTAEVMAKDGWNVKLTKEREEGDEIVPGVPFIPVKVAFDRYPPRIVMITSTARTNINEKNVEILDGVDIARLDLICRGHVWGDSNKGGIKAYLKTMFITIDEDELEKRYGVGHEGEGGE